MQGMSLGLQAICDTYLRQRKAWSFEHDLRHGSDGLMGAAAIVLRGFKKPDGTDDDPENCAFPWAVLLYEKHRDNPAKRSAIAGAMLASAIDCAVFEAGVEEIKESLKESRP